MKSMCYEVGSINLPYVSGHKSMIAFDTQTLVGLPEKFKAVAASMLKGVGNVFGTAYFTIHGRKLKKGNTLRRPGPHTDGNYEPHVMTFGGGGWKVGQDRPGINTDYHARQYLNERGGIILASNYCSSVGWRGEYEGFPRVGGDCSHLELDEPFRLEAGKVYYGNNHFVHESLPVDADVHRVFARITLPESHEFKGRPC